jgi:hypothetical protein
LHCFFKSLHSASNRITIIVVLPYSAYASSINNKLLPAPVGITATIGLSPAVIALIAASYTP